MRRLLSTGLGLLLATGCFAAADEAETTSDTDVDRDSDGESTSTPECDPGNSPVMVCEGDTVVTCNEDGSVTRSGCSDDSVCAVGSEGAGCVWLRGFDCDSAGEPAAACIDPGGIIACVSGQWGFEGCAHDERCVDDFWGATCVPDSTPACDLGKFESRCEGADRVLCTESGIETLVECDVGHVCAERVDGGDVVCVAQTSEACSPDGFETHCEGNVLVGCDETIGRTFEADCGADSSCRETPVGSLCIPNDSVACDPSAPSPSCAKGVASGCGPTGYVYETLCGPETTCAIDQTCFLGCGEIAGCVRNDAAACDEPSDLFCDDDAVVWCFDGRVIFETPCKSGCAEGACL